MRDSTTGAVTYVAMVWTHIAPLASLDDPALWTATNYYPPFDRRGMSLRIPDDQARANLARCQWRTAAARGTGAP